jgi:hypothetical protein
MASHRPAVAILVLAGALVFTSSCRDADAAEPPPLFCACERPWRLQVTELEGLTPGTWEVGAWLVHSTAFDDVGYSTSWVFHRVHTLLNTDTRTATVSLHERFESRAEAGASGWSPAFGEDAAANLDFDVRIPTHSPEWGQWDPEEPPNPDRYGTGIVRLEPKAESRAFSVLFYDTYSANFGPPYEPLVIVDCSGACCLAYRFSLTTHRRRTGCTHAFEGTASEVGTELLGYFSGFSEQGLADLETEELAEMCRDHERLPMDQMGEYDVCDYWSLLNDPTAFCPCTRVECTCSDPDQDCYACGP